MQEEISVASHEVDALMYWYVTNRKTSSQEKIDFLIHFFVVKRIGYILIISVLRVENIIAYPAKSLVVCISIKL